MICPKCGLQNAPSSRQCAQCGAFLPDASDPEFSAANNNGVQDQFVQSAPQEPDQSRYQEYTMSDVVAKKSHKKLIIWLVVIALVLALFKVGAGVQVAVFLILSLVLLGTTRKVFVNKLKTGSQKTNVDALVGEEAVVLEDITPHNTGLVKVKGQNWTAVAYDKDATILKDTTVKVKAIEGVKLIVE